MTKNHDRTKPKFYLLSWQKNVDYKDYKKEIVLHLEFSNGYNNTKVACYQVVKAILYRLKTGCQWRELPMKQFFRVAYRWQSVYYHFQKWSKDGSWEKAWQALLQEHKHLLDMSSVQLDGTHTIVKRGGQSVGYQGRKKSKTTNMLILTDCQGIPLACSKPVAGNHHDSHQLVKQVEQMWLSIEAATINTKGLFLNADSGFDTAQFRSHCNTREIIGNIDQNKRNGQQADWLFDPLLYRSRFVIERTNAWIDAFKALLVRFETNKIHWKALHYIAFITILLRRL